MPERVKFQIARGWMEKPRKRSGAKKLTPAAGLPSCNNSGRGKKLFTAPSKVIQKTAPGSPRQLTAGVCLPGVL
jgi:hypothetical protein